MQFSLHNIIYGKSCGELSIRLNFELLFINLEINLWNVLPNEGKSFTMNLAFGLNGRFCKIQFKLAMEHYLKQVEDLVIYGKKRKNADEVEYDESITFQSLDEGSEWIFKKFGIEKRDIQYIHQLDI